MSTSENNVFRDTQNNVVREAQSVENYNPSAKQKAAAKLSRIPVKVERVRC